MTPTTMKAAVLTGFGGPEVVQVAQRPVPVLKANQVLIRTRAASVNSSDARIRSKTVPKGYKFLMSLVFGFTAPRIETLGCCKAHIIGIKRIGNNQLVMAAAVHPIGQIIGVAVRDIVKPASRSDQ